MGLEFSLIMSYIYIMKDDMNNKGITRTEFNKLMSIPEARIVFNAKLVQLKLTFKDWKLPKGSSNVSLPTVESEAEGEGFHYSCTKIIDASHYQEEGEAEQVKTFLEYFEKHREIRKTVLDSFFLKILPYISMNVTNGKKNG